MKFHHWPWKPRVDEEVDDEVAFHLEMRTRELVDAGYAPDEARREALRRFGDVARVTETCRQIGRGRDRTMKRHEYLSELRRDVAYSARQLRRNPGFAAVAILTLAIGIGATTAIFSAVYAVVLKPLPLREPSQLMSVSESFRGLPGGVSAGNYVDAAAGAPSFDGLAAEQFANFNLTDGVNPERVVGARVSSNFFDVLGSQPAAGRVFTADEDEPGTDTVVVLSHRLWMRRFGGSPAVGRELRLNGIAHTIVGVMPPSFDLAADTEELWVPIAFTPERRAMHDEHYLTVYGRLKRGTTRQRAESELEAVAARLRRENPRDCSQLAFMVVPFVDQFVGDYRSRLFILFGAVGVVLLIACGNVANLLLARGAARAREIAIRSALGAGEWRIVRQLLVESLVLAVIGGAVGLLVARWTLGALVALGPADVPRIDQASIDRVALGFASALALASSVVFGLAPALRLSRTNAQAGLRDGRGTISGIRDRLRASLVVAEIALSVLLLFGAGLLIRSALILQHVDPGFDPHNVFSARFSLPEQSYADPARIVATITQIADDTGRISGVTSAAVTSFAAMGPGGGSNGLIPEGRPANLENAIPSTLRVITPRFFAAMRIPIVRGRAFDERDRAGAPKVMIASEALAAAAFPGQDPIGKRIACCERGPDGGPAFKTIVGVARDVRSRGPATPPGPEFYLPAAQAPDDAWHWFRTFYLVERAGGDAAALAGPSREALARIDRDLALFDVRLMDQRLSGTLATARFNTWLLSILGAIGVVLAAIGVYGVIAYFVTQRTQEIGVRIALGAETRDVVRLVIAQALKPVAVGVAVGAGIALAASRVLSAQLYNVSATDPITLVAVVGALVAVAVGASAIPARRAAKLDPTRALQSL